jgi:hypothetical protein
MKEILLVSCFAFFPVPSIRSGFIVLRLSGVYPLTPLFADLFLYSFEAEFVQKLDN